jgi:hypothetical protein
LTLFFIDIPEVIFNRILGWYSFPTHLLNNFEMDTQLGLLFSDGVILPLVGIIFTFYIKPNHPWRYTFYFVVGLISLEFLYLKLGYLLYIRHWNILYSTITYILGIRLYAHFAPRFVSYSPPVPYWLRLLSFTYASTAWVGAVVGGAFFSLYQFRPHIIKSELGDDRFADIGSSWILGIITAIMIPKVSKRFKFISFMSIALLASVWALFMYRKGWLIYHHWNHFLTLSRYFAPYLLIWWYDRWETTLEKQR